MKCSHSRRLVCICMDAFAAHMENAHSLHPSPFSFAFRFYLVCTRNIRIKCVPWNVWCVCIVFVNVDNKCRRYKNPYYLRSHNFHNQNHSQLIQPLVSHRMYNNIHFPICTLHESHSRLLFLSSFHSRSSTRWEWVCACTCLFHPFVYLHFDYHTNTHTRRHESAWVISDIRFGILVLRVPTASKSKHLAKRSSVSHMWITMLTKKPQQHIQNIRKQNSLLPFHMHVCPYLSVCAKYA